MANTARKDPKRLATTDERDSTKESAPEPRAKQKDWASCPNDRFISLRLRSSVPDLWADALREGGSSFFQRHRTHAGRGSPRGRPLRRRKLGRRSGSLAEPVASA
jgi:hypothetical protein